MENNRPQAVLTIITIVKDDPTGLTRTLKSLTGCELTQVEVLIVDSSADSDQIRNLKQEYLPAASLFWTPPLGIYSAMNTGLERATGEYVWFLNGGDELASPLALESVVSALATKPDWLYGQVEFTKNGEIGVTPPPFDYELEKKRRFSHGRFPPHQGTIVQTRLARELGAFDVEYEIASDYHLMLKLSQVSSPTQIPIQLARFWTGGISTTNWLNAIKEFHDARKAALDLSVGQRIRDRFATDWLRIKTLLAKLPRLTGRR